MGNEYTVQPGDSLWALSRRFDCDIDTIRAANKLGNDTLVAGKKLRLPDGVNLHAASTSASVPTPPPLPPTPKRQGDQIAQVREGDTLWDISQKYGVPCEKLQQANGGSDLHPGQEITIPREMYLSKKSRSISLPQAHSARSSNFWGPYYVTRDVEEYRRHPRVRKLLGALRMVETSNIMPAPVGDGGSSIGPLQISIMYHADAWADRLEERDADKMYKKCEEIPHAERTTIKYWLRWCPWALVFGDNECLARTHNGGPSWGQAPKTARYWRKVRGELNPYDFRTNPYLRNWSGDSGSKGAFAPGSYIPLEARTFFSARVPVPTLGIPRLLGRFSTRKGGEGEGEGALGGPLEGAGAGVVLGAEGSGKVAAGGSGGERPLLQGSTPSRDERFSDAGAPASQNTLAVLAS